MQGLQSEQAKPVPAAFLARHAGLLGRNEYTIISWDYADPICFNFNRTEPTEERDPDIWPHRGIFGNFMRIKSGTMVSVFTKASKKLVIHLRHVNPARGYADIFQIESYNFFCAQPVPTPPPWWQYAKRQVINEHAVSDFSTTNDGILQRLFLKRAPEWTERTDLASAMPLRPAQLPAPIQYCSERQYEVYQTGSLMRDIVFEQTRQTAKAFSGTYSFEFGPLVGNQVRSDRSYIIHLSVRSRSAFIQPTPGPGTPVAVSVQFAHDPVVTEFTGRVIPSPSGDDEFAIAMVVNRKGGRTGFVMSGHGMQLSVVPVLPINADFELQRADLSSENNRARTLRY